MNETPIVFDVITEPMEAVELWDYIYKDCDGLLHLVVAVTTAFNSSKDSHFTWKKSVYFLSLSNSRLLDYLPAWLSDRK